MSEATSAPTVFSGMLAVALHQLYGTSDSTALAERCGVTVRKMGGYLVGEFTPSLGTLARMCKDLSNHRLAQLVRAAEEPAGVFEQVDPIEKEIDDSIRQDREARQRAAEAEERNRRFDK